MNGKKKYSQIFDLPCQEEYISNAQNNTWVEEYRMEQRQFFPKPRAQHQLFGKMWIENGAKGSSFECALNVLQAAWSAQAVLQNKGGHAKYFNFQACWNCANSIFGL